MVRVAHVVTHAVTARTLLRGQLAWLRGRGHDVSLLTSPDDAADELAPGVRIAPVPMDREIRPFRDLAALGRLVRALRELRPDVLNASTPKAGLLGVLAGTLARVPVRVYLLRGLRLETATGLQARVLGLAERVACSLAHEVVCVSESLRRRAIADGLVAPDRICVFGAGSSTGVDARRYRPRSPDDPELGELRALLGLPADAPVIGFVGRLTRDKGLEDLWRAFETHVLPRHPRARLLLVGEPEPGDPVAPDLLAALTTHPQVVRTTGWVGDTAPYYSLMSVLAFPSYREGLPNAPLEAAASAIPVAAFEATGTLDAVVDGVTGTLVPRGDGTALGEALVRYLDDPALARAHGEAGRARAVRDFAPERVWALMEAEYLRLLAEVPDGAARLRRAVRRLARSRALKRTLDLTLASTTLVVTSPALLAALVAVRLGIGHPVLFAQRRPGLHGQPFTVYKLRTMTDARGPDGRLLPDADRLTALGRLLRSTSVDELPELWNVLRGDMSFVGPRPLLMEYLDRYTPAQARRHDVKPGLTGWAAVNGRNALTWEEKFALDVWYVYHWSLGLDLWILARTLATVLRREGIQAPGAATMPAFLGSPTRERPPTPVATAANGGGA